MVPFELNSFLYAVQTKKGLCINAAPSALLYTSACIRKGVRNTSCLAICTREKAPYTGAYAPLR